METSNIYTNKGWHLLWEVNANERTGRMDRNKKRLKEGDSFEVCASHGKRMYHHVVDYRAKRYSITTCFVNKSCISLLVLRKDLLISGNIKKLFMRCIYLPVSYREFTPMGERCIRGVKRNINTIL